MVHDGAASERLERLDGPAARRWAIATRAALAAHRSEIDRLNVFPVPDGDTGTNLYLTVDAALEAIAERSDGLDLASAAADLSRATLLAARGNSGVILSQIVRGLTEVIAETARSGERVDGVVLAEALRRASDLAYASVTRPVEGTILTVARAAASAAARVVRTDPSLYAVASAALTAARESLAGTPAQLAALARAGVVDAGGAGYVLVLEALERVVVGDLPPRPRPRLRPATGPPAGVAATGAEGEAPEAEGPAYEVMYLLSDSGDEAVAVLRERLDALGDSVLVVGEAGLWNVHVHTDDVGAAIEAGIEAGRPHRIAVTHFRDQVHHQLHERPRVGVSVVACVSGAGLAEVFARSGAAVVASGPGQRASAGQLLRAVREARTSCVLVLPNDADTQLAAEAAAAAATDEGIEVQVVRSGAAVQGIAALAVFDPEASLPVNLLAMSAAAAATRHGAVTVASRDALTSAGWCRPGDVLGVVDGDVVVVGADPAAVGGAIVERLLGSGGELVTIVAGQDAGAELGARVAARAREARRDAEVTMIEGGQPTYLLLLGVE